MAARLLPLAFSVAAAADAPGGGAVIVLVHGWFGWGPTEMFGFKYWGGVNSIANEMSAAGHDVRVATVGPVSSNWDRAVELYANIKGGRVDYGALHAATFNHSRYGLTFPGIFPEWGTRGLDGTVRQVHLVGHSMGGQTVRMLLRLLADGDAGERRLKGATSIFDGGRAAWVRSLSTVNTPHDGSTIFDDLGSTFVDDVAWPLFKGICAIWGVFNDTLPYDFKLGQFGLERRNGEGFISYSDRVMNSSIWNVSFRDFSSWDLSVAGATELNRATPAVPSVYYFSYASVATKKSWFSSHQVADSFMWEFLKPNADLMGRTGDASWWPNDGVVNTLSHTGPKLGSKDVVALWTNGTVRPGIWNYMGARDGVDHLEMVGMGVQRVQAYYRRLAATLATLPGPPLEGFLV